MKLRYLLTTYLFLCLFIISTAQDNGYIYATVATDDVEILKRKHPNEIEILGANDIHTAVYISEPAISYLQEIRLTPGPGYVFRQSREDALAAVQDLLLKSISTYEFSINHEYLVNMAIELVDPINIEEHIILLENYGTRFHTTESAIQSAYDLRDLWMDMASAAGREDITIELFDHSASPMPSVILTVPGLVTPNEIVIIGAHLDSTSSPDVNEAPGADDNASGVATITEVARVLFEIDFMPARTIEFMAFSAEEVGLKGSSDIASNYRSDDKNVIAYVNFDMTNYKGSEKDIYLMTDSYNSSNLNNFLMELMDFYNSSGDHQFEYSTSICYYACSDNYSWAEAGYEAVFPFEAKLYESNPNIHSINDTYSFMGNSLHAAKFAKLGLQFMIEAAKSSTTNLPTNKQSTVNVFSKNQQINIRSNSTVILNSNVYDLSGRLILTQNISSNQGVIDVGQRGFFLLEIITENNERIIEKVIVQ